MPIAGQCFQPAVVFNRVAADQMAGQYPEDAEDAPSGMDQMVEGQVVINREENPRFAIDAVGEVPLDFKLFGHRIAERHNQPGDQPVN